MRTQPIHNFDTHVEAVMRPFLIAFATILIVMVLSLGLSNKSFAQEEADSPKAEAEKASDKEPTTEVETKAPVASPPQDEPQKEMDVSKDIGLKAVKEIPVIIPESMKAEAEAEAEAEVEADAKAKEAAVKVAMTLEEAPKAAPAVPTAAVKSEPVVKTEAEKTADLSPLEDEADTPVLSILKMDTAINPKPNYSMVEQSDAVETPNENLFVTANKGVLLRLKKPVSDIFIADPSVADVQVKSPRILYVFGKKTGQTSLFAMNETDDVVFSANLTVEQDIAEVQNALDMLLPTTNIRVKGINGMIILDGYVDSPEDAAMAERMVKAIVKDGPQLMSRLIIATPTQINLRVKIAEVNRDIMKELGVNWENALSGDNILFGVATGTDPVSYVTDPVTGIVEKVFNVRNSGTNSLVGNFRTGNLDLNTVVDALEGEGYLSVLAEPNLTAISGKPANFLAGGEFPVPVPDQGEIGIEYKQFGVGLNFTPTVLSDRKINLEVAPEVSQLSSAGAIRMNGISVPSISTRRVSTTVELGSGQSFAIAGLIQNNITGDTSKVPGLGDIPILGALFRSERFRKQETELVVIVTPYIVRPMDERQIVLPTDGQIIPTDYQRYLSGKGLSQEARPQTLSKGKKGRASLGQAGFRIGQR